MSSKNPIRVLVADDSPTALQSICEYLRFAGGFEVVCTASDGLNAVQLASRHILDLVLLDLSMPRLNGLEASAQLRRQLPQLRVVIFSELNGLSLRDECQRRGADSFVHKGELPDGLISEIRKLFPERAS